MQRQVIVPAIISLLFCLIRIITQAWLHFISIPFTNKLLGEVNVDD